MPAVSLCGSRGTLSVSAIIAFETKTNAVVTPLRKAASYEPRIAILGNLGNTWLTRGKYGIYVVVMGLVRGLREAFCQVKSALSTAVSPTWR